MVQKAEEINLTPEQEVIVKAFRKRYPEASRFTAVKFCFGRKFELDRIFTLYEAYSKMMEQKQLKNLQATDVLAEMRTRKMYIPGSRDLKGAALFVVQTGKHVPGQFPSESTIKLAFYLGQVLTASVKTQRNGVSLLIDLEGTEWSSFDPKFMSEIIGFFQNHIPASVKSILIWRAPWWIRSALQIVSPFLKEKMRKRIHLCDNLHALNAFVATDQLTAEFGGSFEYDHDYFVRRELGKSSSDDVITSLTEEQIEAAEGEMRSSTRLLAMYSTTKSILSAEVEASLQKERDDQIEVVEVKIQTALKEDSGSDEYPVPIYDITLNRALRLSLDLAAHYRPLAEASDPQGTLNSCWKEAQFAKEPEIQVEMMLKALKADEKDYNRRQSL